MDQQDERKNNSQQQQQQQQQLTTIPRTLGVPMEVRSITFPEPFAYEKRHSEPPGGIPQTVNRLGQQVLGITFFCLSFNIKYFQI